jgi:hypothetical protein
VSIGYKNGSAVLPVCTPVFTDMRAAQILHARMDFLGCPYSIHPHGPLAFGHGVANQDLAWIWLWVRSWGGFNNGKCQLAIKIVRPFCRSARPFSPTCGPLKFYTPA